MGEENKVNVSSGGISLFGLLFVVLVVMKLAGIGSAATLSWWWVFSPLLIGFGLAVVVIIAAIVIAAIASR